MWDVGPQGVRLAGPRDFLILVALGDDDESPRYWIVPAAVAARCVRMNKRPSLPRSGVKECEDAWDLLDR